MSETTIKQLPFVVTVCELASTGFDKATVLIRQGYQFSPEGIVQVFPDGVCSFTLTLGTPTEAAIAAAEQARVDALAQEEAEFGRRVQAAAKAIVDQQARDEKEKQLATLRKEQEKQIAKLQAELANT